MAQRAHHPDTRTTATRQDRPAKRTHPGRARPAVTTGTGTPRTVGATTAEPRAASHLSARTRAPPAADAHPDGGRDLPARLRLLRDRAGRGPQCDPLDRLPDAKRRIGSASAVHTAPRQAPATRGRGRLVRAATSCDSEPRDGAPRALR